MCVRRIFHSLKMSFVIGINASKGFDVFNLLNGFHFVQDVQIGQRMITISTVGVPNTIKKLASHKLQSTLALR